MANCKIGGRDRDRTCGLIHAMDALSQLSYTPVFVQIELLAVWQTAKIILTNPSMKFHCDACAQLWVGQPLLAVRVRPAMTSRDSQEWLSYCPHFH